MPKPRPSTHPMRPKPLQPGDLIGVVSPARWLEPARIEAGAKVLEDAGFRVCIDPQNDLRNGAFAGPDDARRAAIERQFADPEVKAIVCARGGYGALRIADALDYGLIAANPKHFVGYSDITGLLLGLWKHAGFETCHGPMLIDLAGGADPDGAAQLVATLGGKDAGTAEAMAAAATCLRPGSGEGPLIGGNLTILANLIGTAGDVDTAGAVLFIEDVDEHLYSIDRLLLHLKRAGRLDRLAALVLGSFTGLKDGETPFGRTVEQMVLEHCAGSAFPIVARIPIGHNGPNTTVRIGAAARVEAGRSGKVSFAFPG